MAGVCRSDTQSDSDTTRSTTIEAASTFMKEHSGPNLWQSADCGKLESLEPQVFSRKQSFPINFRSFFFCFSEVALFQKKSLRFRLLRTWGFASEKLCLALFPSSTSLVQPSTFC